MKDSILQGDCLTVLKTLPAESVDCVVTSPPYWALRDYGVEGQIGLEASYQEYIKRLCDVFDEVRRVLKKTGTCWVNIGDTYGGTAAKGKNDIDPKNPVGRNIRGKAPNSNIMHKSLIQIPARFAIEMALRGWILRNELIWHKPNAMPSSAKDRFTVDFEKIYFFTKSRRYHFKQQLDDLADSTRKDRRTIEGSYTTRRRKRDYVGDAQQGSGMLKPTEGKRNARSVWSITTRPYKGAHFAVFPEALVERPILAGSTRGGLVLDPFMGSGTTAVVAKRLGRHYVGIELNSDYIAMAELRLSNTQLLLPIEQKSARL